MPTGLEAAGAAAAILQLASTAGKTAFEVYEFCSTVRDAPREILGISNNVNALQNHLRSLELSLRSDAVQGVISDDAELGNALETLTAPLENCGNSLKYVNKRMRSSAPNLDLTAETATQRSRFNRKNILWPFKRNEIHSLLAELERSKSTLSDAMGAVTLYVVRTNGQFPSLTFLEA